MMWVMTEAERLECVRLSVAMGEIATKEKTLRRSVTIAMTQLAQERLIVDRQQNLWMLRFALKHGIDSLHDLIISPKEGTVLTRQGAKS